METTIVCPYPNHQGYLAVRDTLIPAEQKTMAENIHITADQKVEIVPLHKKFSLLSAEHNGVDIFSGDYVDKSNKKGVSGVTYFTGEAAERIAAEQGKKLFNTKEEAQAFMSCFPGENEEARVRNFAALMGLQKAGYWNPDNKKWINVGSYGFATLSKVLEDGYVYRAYWYDVYANVTWLNQKCPTPVVASEDC